MKAKTIIIDGVEYALTPVTPVSQDQFIGEVNGKRYYLGPEAAELMTQQEARGWCESLGYDFELPSRVVMLLCYNNEELRNQFETEGYYWTDDVYENRSSDGWYQYTNFGIQSYANKTTAFYVRAVRVENAPN